MLDTLRSFVLDLLFPPRCAHCGRVDSVWCPVCGQLLDQTPLQINHDGWIASGGEHSGILQSAVHGLKYYGVKSLSASLGSRAADTVRAVGWQIDLVIAVPAHAERVRARGYNQAALIADACARALGGQAVPDALERIRHTRSQVGLTREERLSNVTDAFAAHTEIVSGRRVLLVDDVCTTGATLQACAESLRAAGVSEVYAVTISRALQ